jgi:hypothetical protein
MTLGRLIPLSLITVMSVLLYLSVCQAQSITFEWSKPVDITQPSSTDQNRFGVLLCDQYQNVHLLWSGVSEAEPAIFYRNDVNAYWSNPVDILAVPDRFILRLAGAASNTSDTVHLIWTNMHASAELYYSQASLSDASNPRAWSRPQVLAEGVHNAQIQTDSAGVIHVSYGVSEDERMRPTVYHIKSEDDGTTWSDPVVVFSTPSPLPSFQWVEMDIDDTDQIHVGVSLRSEEYGVYSEVGYVRSSDGGQTWSEYERIDKMGTTFQGVHIIAPYAFGKDEIHLTWHDPRRMHQWSFDGGDTWSNPIEIMHLGAAFGGPNQLVKDSAGTLHVVTSVASGVFSAAWNGTQWRPPERIDDRFIDPHGQNMIVCQGNQLHVVYYDRLGGIRVWYASRQVEAPHIERQLLPKPTPQPTVTATPDIFPSPEPTAISETSWPITATVVSPASWFSILIATIPAAILVVSVVITVLRRPRA